MASPKVGFISDADMTALESKQSPKKAGFISDEEMKKIAGSSEAEKTSGLESAARGFAQGALLNWADELTGGAEAVADRIGGSDAPISDLYLKHRNESRENYKKAQEDNPRLYTAGEIGGAIGSTAIPFGQAGTAAKALQVGFRQGAAAGLGGSEADNLAQATEDTFAGGVMGLLGAGLAHGATSVYKGAASKLASKAEDVASAPSRSNWESVGDVGKSYLERVKSFWKPEVDPKWSEFKEIAQKHGIDPKSLPDAVQFGPDSAPARYSRSLAEGELGGETLKKFKDSLGQVRNAYDQKIKTYAGGLPTDEITAGKILRDSYDDGVKEFFDQMDFTHNNIVNQVPGLKLTESSQQAIDSALNGIEKFAKGRMVRGVTATQRGQGQQLQNAVEAIRAGNGSYKQTVEALRDIGEAAFQSKNSLADIPVDVQKMRKLYNDVSGALIDTVRSDLGEDIANRLVQNNKAMSEFFGNQSHIARLMGDKSVAPESAFRSLLMSGDSQQINALKKIIPADRWNYFKGAVLENLAKRDPEGEFTFKQLFNSARNKKSTLSTIFEPEEIGDTVGLIRLGDRFGSPVHSTSGTGTSVSLLDTVKDVGNQVKGTIALRNARAAGASADAGAKTVRDVSPRIKSLPEKAAGAVAASGLNDSPDKGVERWTNDGLQKLKSLDSSFFDESLISKIKSSPAGRSLLIEASRSKTSPEKLQKIMDQIKTQFKSKGGP